MIAAPSTEFFKAVQVSDPQLETRTKLMNNLAKSNVSFRDASRREDATHLRAAFDGPTQQAIAERGSRALGVSPRQIINWMHMEHDMPSWAVKAVKVYLGAVEKTAQRIEGSE